MLSVDLRYAIDSMATVEGPILKVDRFLNHRVEPSLMAGVGRQIAAMLEPLEPDLLLTAEASGIPPALAAGMVMEIPIVYAKKYLGPGGRYTFSREVASPTKGTEYRVEVARHVLPPGLRVAIVDDFLEHLQDHPDLLPRLPSWDRLRVTLRAYLRGLGAPADDRAGSDHRTPISSATVNTGSMMLMMSRARRRLTNGHSR